MRRTRRRTLSSSSRTARRRTRTGEPGGPKEGNFVENREEKQEETPSYSQAAVCA